MNGISDKNKQSVKTKPDAHLTEIWFKSLLHHNEGLLFPVVSFSFSEPPKDLSVSIILPK